MSRQPQNNPAPRSLSHEEAEELLSARLDAPIDPWDNRALLSHMQSCQSCRAFAVHLEVMARDLEALPRLPASPAVRREVHNRIQAPPPLWSRLSAPNPSGGFGRALPAALAAMVLLVALTTYVLVELTNSTGGGLGSTGGSISAPGEVAILVSPTPSSASDAGALVALETIAPSPTARVIVSPTGNSGGPEQVGGLATTTPQADRDGPNDSALAQALPSSTSDAQTASAKTPAETPATTLEQPNGAAGASDISAASSGSAADATATNALPTETVEPTPTPSTTPTVTPSPTAEPPTVTATATPSSTPTEEPTVPPTSTATVTSAPSETPEPTATATAQPTWTPTLEPTSTPTAVPTNTPTFEPTATETQEPTATATPDPTETPTASPVPTETHTPTPTATPEEEVLQGQPTIQPRGGSESSEIQGQGSAGGEEGSTTIQPSGGDPEIQSEESGSAAIAPSEGGSTEAGATDTPDPAEGDPDGTGAAAGGQTSLLLDSAPVTADLGGDISAPSGRLEFRTGLDVFCVTLADGSLGVMNTSGTTLMSFGAGAYPSWSPQGLVLLYADVSSGNSRVMTWDAQTGSVYSGGAPSDRSFTDTPAGWSGDRFYYQRTFPESPGEIEFHSAAWDGSDDQLIWSASEIYPISSRPAATEGGFLIATSSVWMQISTSGDAWEVGSNPYGSIGVVIMGPGRSLIAYTAGSEIIVAEATNPGAALGSMPFTGGFDFASSGAQIVISNGSALDIYSIYGEFLGTALGSSPTGPPYWVDDTIYFLDLGGSTTLRYVSASDILAQ